MTAKQIKDQEAGDAIERLRSLVNAESKFPRGPVEIIAGRTSTGKTVTSLDDLKKLR